MLHIIPSRQRQFKFLPLFSLPEPEAQVSYSDQNLSVVGINVVIVNF